MQLTLEDDFCQLPPSDHSSMTPAPASVCQELLQHLPAAAGPSFQKQLRKSGVAVALGFALLTHIFFLPSVWFLISNVLDALQN